MQAKIQLFSELLPHIPCFFPRIFYVSPTKRPAPQTGMNFFFLRHIFPQPPAYSSKSSEIFSVSQCGICISHCEICIPHCGFCIPQCETENLSRNFIFYTREFRKIPSPLQTFTPVRKRLHDFKQAAKNGQRDFFCNFAAN